MNERSVFSDRLFIFSVGLEHCIGRCEGSHIPRSREELTLEQMNELIGNIEERVAEFREVSEMATLERELDVFANDNIPEYKKLTAPEQEAVRETMRRARANGFSEADQIILGRIAAKSGLKIITTKNMPGVDNFRDERYAIKKDANGEIYVDVQSQIISNDKSPKAILSTLSEIVKNKFSDYVQPAIKLSIDF